MHKIALVVGAVASTGLAAPAASPANDPTHFITNIISKFNNGDTKAWLAAQDNNVLIIDDFGPHMWSGPNSAERWLRDYMKESAKRGDSGGHMDYSKPIATDVDASTAYIVMPTTWHFVEKGKKMAGAGSMTFVAKREGTGWKIASWTYSGATPTVVK